MYKILWLGYLFNVVMTATATKEGLNIGKFDLRLNSIEVCKGPKQKECGALSVQVYNNTALAYKLNLKRTMKFTKAKVVVQTNGHDLVRLQITNPCEHVILKQVIYTAFNLTSACALLPGQYEMAYDLEKIAKTYYGGSFMYGDYAFKTFFLGEDCNLSCVTVHVTFMPQNKN